MELIIADLESEPHSSTLHICNSKEETIERIIKQELAKQQKAAAK